MYKASRTFDHFIQKMKFFTLIGIAAAQKTTWFASCPAPTIIDGFDLSRVSYFFLVEYFLYFSTLAPGMKPAVIQ